MSVPTVIFSRRLERPLEDCLAALDRWAVGRAPRSAREGDPNTGAPPLRYRVAVATGVLRRRRLLEIRMGPWAGSQSTHLELVPSRAVRPTRRYLAGCRHLLDELVTSTLGDPAPSPSRTSDPTGLAPVPAGVGGQAKRLARGTPAASGPGRG